MENQIDLPSIQSIILELVSVSSLTKMSEIKRLPLAMISQQTSLRYFFEEMSIDGESDKPPLDPGHKPRIGLCFLFNQDVSPGMGNIQGVSNKERAT